nr:spidroin-1-like [Aegilops tauschii subsp. strangulata]
MDVEPVISKPPSRAKPAEEKNDDVVLTGFGYTAPGNPTVLSKHSAKEEISAEDKGKWKGQWLTGQALGAGARARGHQGAGNTRAPRRARAGGHDVAGAAGEGPVTGDGAEGRGGTESRGRQGRRSCASAAAEVGRTVAAAAGAGEARPGMQGKRPRHDLIIAGAGRAACRRGGKVRGHVGVSSGHGCGGNDGQRWGNAAARKQAVAAAEGCRRAWCSDEHGSACDRGGEEEIGAHCGRRGQGSVLGEDDGDEATTKRMARRRSSDGVRWWGVASGAISNSSPIQSSERGGGKRERESGDRGRVWGGSWG